MQLDAAVEMPSVLQHTHGSITALFFFPSIILLAKETDLDRVARTTAGADPIPKYEQPSSGRDRERGSFPSASWAQECAVDSPEVVQLKEQAK